MCLGKRRESRRGCPQPTALALLLLLCLGTAWAVEVSLNASPGFESGFDGWSNSDGNLDVSTPGSSDPPCIEGASCLVTVYSTTFEGSLNTTLQGLTIGQNHTLTFWARSTTGDTTSYVKVSVDGREVLKLTGTKLFAFWLEKYGCSFRPAGSSVTLTLELFAVAVDDVHLYNGPAPIGTSPPTKQPLPPPGPSGSAEVLGRLQSPGFEDDFNGWYNADSLEIYSPGSEDPPCVEGSFYLKTEYTIFTGSVSQLLRDLTAGENYTLTLWARCAPVAPGGSVVVRVDADVALKVVGEALSLYWTRYSGSFRAANSFATLELVLDGGEAGVVYVDDLHLYAGPAPMSSSPPTVTPVPPAGPSGAIELSLLKSPGFEDDLTGWFETSSVEVTATDPHEGVACLKTPYTVFPGALHQFLRDLTAGATYSVSLWAKIESAGADSAVEVSVDGERVVRALGDALGGTWREFSGTFKPARSFATLGVRMESGSGGIVSVDDVRLYAGTVKGAPPSPTREPPAPDTTPTTPSPSTPSPDPPTPTPPEGEPPTGSPPSEDPSPGSPPPAVATPRGSPPTSTGGSGDSGGSDENSNVIKGIAGAGAGAILTGVIGLLFYFYQTRWKEGYVRRQHPFADRLRKRLKLRTLQDFESEPGKRYVASATALEAGLIANQPRDKSRAIADLLRSTAFVDLVAGVLGARYRPTPATAPAPAASENLSEETFLRLWTSDMAEKAAVTEIVAAIESEARAKGLWPSDTLVPVV